MPLLSVVMPVRNGVVYVREAVESILTQTYADFEFIIVDDGSEDGTLEVLQDFDDIRIKIVKNPGFGLVDALNSGFGIANGKFVARMDADDIACPERFERQIAEFTKDPSIGVVSSNVACIDENGVMFGELSEYDTTATRLKDYLLLKRFGKPIVHPSVMISKEKFFQVGGYRQYDAAEDHDLWLRLIDVATFRRLPQLLLKYRVHSGGVSHQKREVQAANTLLSCVNYHVQHSSSVDLYRDHPVLWRDVCAHLLMLVRDDRQASLAFEALKQAVRRRAPISIITAACSGFLGSGLAIFPSYRRSRRIGKLTAYIDASKKFAGQDSVIPWPLGDERSHVQI